MAFVKVTVEWRKGSDGSGGTYTFYPKPSLTRVVQGKRQAELIVPLADGVVIQTMGLEKRVIELKGVLINKTNNWDTMEGLRNDLINGIGVGEGQLHLISPDRHIRYQALITSDGINFTEQTRSNIQDYTITVTLANGYEITVDTTKTINSNAEIS